MKTQKKARKLQFKTILRAVMDTCEKYKIDIESYQKGAIAKQLTNLNDILAGCVRYSGDSSTACNPYNKIFALCVKEPRNLDSGRHYFSVNYIKDGEIQKVWLWDFIKHVGGYDQNRDRNMDKFVFGSGAIGMSRVLDATDGLFSYLRSIGGFYTQIYCK